MVDYSLKFRTGNKQGGTERLLRSENQGEGDVTNSPELWLAGQNSLLAGNSQACSQTQRIQLTGGLLREAAVAGNTNVLIPNNFQQQQFATRGHSDWCDTRRYFLQN